MQNQSKKMRKRTKHFSNGGNIRKTLVAIPELLVISHNNKMYKKTYVLTITAAKRPMCWGYFVNERFQGEEWTFTGDSEQVKQQFDVRFIQDTLDQH